MSYKEWKQDVDARMKTYNCHFRGRKVGALGIEYDIWTQVQATNKENALLKLYNDYEHIGRREITEVEK